MNKRQIKKQAYKEQVIFSYGYKANKRIKRFLESLIKRKNDGWRTSRKEFYRMICRGAADEKET